MMKHPIKAFLLGTVLVLGAQQVNAQEGARPEQLPRLFLEDTAQDPGAPMVVQARAVKVNFAALNAVGVGAELEFNLFEDVTVRGKVDKIEDLSDGNRALSGQVLDEPHAFFALVFGTDIAVANVRLDQSGAVYHLRRPKPGLHVVRSIDETQMPPCGTGPEQQVHTAESAAPRGDLRPPLPEFTAQDDGSQFDVMILWTNKAENSAGGMASMNALVDLCITSTNQVYNNSNINSQLRLVHKSKVGYSESSDFGGHLSLLAGTSDGRMDQIHAIRDSVGADLVALLVRDGQYCGIGYLMTTLSNGFASSAFSVSNWGCAVGNLTFPHELGHNQGCAHDHDNANSALFSYSYGHRFFGNGGGQYRTIMSYSPGSRIQYMSNPNINFDGQPTGVPAGQFRPADNALSINTAANTIANWRTYTIGSTTFQSGDIVSVDLTTGNASFVFDQSDVMSNADVNAIAERSDGSFLLSFHQTTSVSGLTGGPSGNTVEAADLVHFVPTQLGSSTAGSFSFFFDGSDVGLDDTGDDDIDAVHEDDNGRLYLSLKKPFFVIGANGQDEDLVRFVPTSLGASTAGSWSMYFDGDDPDVVMGSNGEDTDALTILSNGDIILSVNGSYRVPLNHTGDDDDLLNFIPTTTGPTTTGTFMFMLQGAEYGLTGGDIDGLVLMP
jgi:hypothetical protein